MEQFASDMQMYITMVCDTIVTTVPKSVVHCLVRKAEKNLLNHLFGHVHKMSEEELQRMLTVRLGAASASLPTGFAAVGSLRRYAATTLPSDRAAYGDALPSGCAAVWLPWCLLWLRGLKGLLLARLHNSMAVGVQWCDL
jgi:hypothetical protein